MEDERKRGKEKLLPLMHACTRMQEDKRKFKEIGEDGISSFPLRAHTCLREREGRERKFTLSLSSLFSFFLFIYLFIYFLKKIIS